MIFIEFTYDAGPKFLATLAPTSSLVGLLRLGLTRLLRQPFAKAFGTGMLAVDRWILLGDMVRFRERVVAHGVFGVLETAAFIVDVLRHAHYWEEFSTFGPQVGELWLAGEFLEVSDSRVLTEEGDGDCGGGS